MYCSLQLVRCKSYFPIRASGFGQPFCHGALNKFLLEKCYSNSIRRSFSNTIQPACPHDIGQSTTRRFSVGSVRSFTSTTASCLPDTRIDEAPLDDRLSDLIPAKRRSGEGRIRERLRSWEAEDGSAIPPKFRFPTFMNTDVIPNTGTRPEESDSFVNAEDEDVVDDYFASGFEPDEALGTDKGRILLQPGDLVELRTSSGARSELAIFVRDLQSQSQFYTMSGRWMQQRAAVIQFSIPNFVEPVELDPLLPLLPSEDVPEAMQAKLQTISNAPDRSLGATLVRKMQVFWRESNAKYRASSRLLGNAHMLLADKRNFRYLTLEQITNELLPSAEEHHASTLYAVHCSILGGFGFRRIGYNSTWGQYEISPKDEHDALHFVRNQVRLYQEHLGSRARKNISPLPQKMSRFIKNARILIDDSRKRRSPTPYGTLGPLQRGSADTSPRIAQIREEIQVQVPQFLHFLQSWTAFRTFPWYSSMHGIGSSLLRAIDRYEGSSLDQTCGWILLKELGFVAPWETRAGYDVRLPPQAKNGLSMVKPLDHSYNLVQDTLKDIRIDWGDQPVYCIDAARAHEIDDGISIESTEVSDEFWIHTHTADPASHIAPNSSLANEALNKTQTAYLTDRVVNMLPADLVQSKFSLAPDRPCLTFSARIDSKGQIVDHKVTAGVVRNVIYLTPSTLGEVLELGKQDSHYTRAVSVGSVDSENEDGERHMAGVSDLTGSHKENLKRIFALGAASLQRKLQHGAFFPPHVDHSISVSFKRDNTSQENHLLTDVTASTDPIIKLEVRELDSKHGGFSTLSAPVMSIMLLASEVGARWCNERGIPIIYRVTHQKADKQSPLDFFHQHVFPTMDSSLTPSPTAAAEYLNLIRVVLPSSTPAPHIAVGAEMTTRCTSPLRRYSDLITHWQIEAALLKEAENGKSVMGYESMDYLPFSKSQINSLIPHLYIRERMLKEGSVSSYQEWRLQLLLRAWAFKETQLPATFPFIASRIGTGNLEGLIAGKIEVLGDLTAWMEPFEGMQAEDVNVGDCFEVEIKNINVYTRRLRVQGLRLVGSAIEVMKRWST